MTTTAAVPTAVYGTELLELSSSQYIRMQSAAATMLWKGKTWRRCVATTYTLIVPGPRLVGKPAVMYHTLLVACRLLTKRPALRDRFCQVWHAVSEHDDPCDSAVGPVRRLFQVIQSLQATWPEPFFFVTYEGARVDLSAVPTEKWKHALREAALRCSIWRQDAAYSERIETQTADRIAYETTVALFRGSGKRTASLDASYVQLLSFIELSRLKMV